MNLLISFYLKCAPIFRRAAFAIVTIVVTFLILSLPVLAGDAPAASEPGWVTSVVNALGGVTTIATILGGGLLEILMRRWPTAKPWSILYMAGATLRGVGKICTVLGDLFDKIVPQKVKPG